ncbi:hypothetical protein [uncultured Algoriphagus sp.]|uniref:hypothetical protein n=1 Tax=uncultured Algoriphagus sp. TaxID=417365 RepID=UPI0025977213|nr:hypothetical protein [uncultured Algoriphagus sp.]
MKQFYSNSNLEIELPLQLNISFEKVYLMFKKYAGNEFKSHPFHKSAKVMVAEIEKEPVLIHGFSDFSLLEKHKEKIDLLLTEGLKSKLGKVQEVVKRIGKYEKKTTVNTSSIKNILEGIGV